MRTAARTDRNQAEIVAQLRKMGCMVQPLHMVGKGCPDILVGYKGRNFLFEIKDPKQPPSKRRLTEDERQWHLLWREFGGQVDVIHTAEEAMEKMKF